MGPSKHAYSLCEVTWGFGVRCHPYACNILLCFSLPVASEKAVEVLNCCLDSVVGWVGPKNWSWILTKWRTKMFVYYLIWLGFHFTWRSRDGAWSPPSTTIASWSWVAQSTFYQIHLVYQPFLDSGSLARAIHALLGLLQCVICGATLENGLETSN